MVTLTIVDLFSGAGGFSCGVVQAFKKARNVQVRLIAVDKNQLALQTYQDNLGGEFIHCTLDPRDPGIATGTITLLDPSVLGKVHGLIGSPPCQSFSGMNVRGDRCLDMTLVKAFMAIKKYLKPRWWIMEESPFVPFPGARYLRACDHGLYHQRRRLFAGNYPPVHPTRPCPVRHPTPVAEEVKAYNKHMRLKRKARNPSQYFGRRLHPWELQVLMGFPSWYRFRGTITEQIRQIGNAVCPPVSKAIFEQVILHPRYSHPVQASLQEKDDFKSWDAFSRAMPVESR